MQAAVRWLLVLCFFVCPLLFFTNLTRNPYVTQICLLSIALLWAAAARLAGAAWRGEGAWPFPRTALDLPWLGVLGAAALSWSVAYFGHAPFFRSAMVNEGLRNGVFIVANALCPFYLAAACQRESAGQAPAPALGPWVGFVLVWGLLWTAFPQMRGPGAPPGQIWGLVWDGYGAFLWAAGAAAALWLCRRGAWIDFLHLALATGFLASVYGVFQYFNVDFIWPNVLNPYGGRSVSTFGNPNFMSSFNVVLLPAAVVLFIESRGPRRLAYGVLVLALEAALLCSLTRSSWLGALMGLAILCASPDLRRAVREDPRPHGLLLALAAAMALLWPQSLIVSGYRPSVIGRVIEAGRIIQESGPYSPWHQRLLIWTCAWLMGAENPLTGKGWGLFELFYPFYQGYILDASDFYRSMRTHANNAHNELMEVWAQGGLLGLGAFFWLWTAFLRTAANSFRSGRGVQDALLAAAAAGVAGMLVDNLLNVSLHFAVPGFLFWWWAGTVVGAATPGGALSPAGPPSGVPSGPASSPWAGLRRSAAFAGALLLVGLSWYWVKLWNRETHYFAGFKLLRQGNLPAAVKELEFSRRWGPLEVNAVYELGNAYARSERFLDADQTYAEALKANAGYDEIYYNIGAIKSSRLGQLDAAIDYYRVSRWINPLSGEAYNSLGNLYLQNPARYGGEALRLLERAVHFFPENPNHWNNLGYLYSLERRYADAEEAYGRALTLDPGMAVAERNLAALSAQAKRPKPKLLQGLESLRELEARLSRRDYSDESLALARRVAGQFPEMPKARFLLGSLILARGRPAEALESLEWVAARQPSHLWAYLNLGEAYLALGRSRDAAERFRAVLVIDPQNAQAQARLKALAFQ